MTDAPDEFDTVIDDPDDDDDDEPVSKEEHERTKAALKRANAEAKKHRLEKRDLLKQIKDSDSGTPDDKKATELQREKIREEVREVEDNKWRSRVVRQAARAALLEAGLTGSPTQLARLVDPSEVEIDDDGEVVSGLDEQIEQFKEDYPALFEDKETARAPVRRSGRIDGGDRGRQVRTKPLSSAEKIQQRALGRRPR